VIPVGSRTRIDAIDPQAEPGGGLLRLVRNQPLPRLVWVLAAVLLPTVLFTAVVLPLTPARLALRSAALIDELAVWSWVAGLPWPVPEGPALVATLLGVGACAFAAYGLVLVACWDRAASAGTLLAVLLPAVVFVTVSAFALPTQSGDVIDYLLSGRVAAEHGASPYGVAPDAFPDDPLRPYASGTYTDDAEAKPPVWIAFAVAMAAVAGDDPAVAVLVARLVFLGITLLNLGLIAAILRRWRPQHLLAGLVLYGWSPVVTLHGQAKFDSLMATFALLAALLLVVGRRHWVMPALWLSVLVKLLTLPLLAAYALGEIFARRWRRLAVSTALVAAVTVAAYAPFDGGPFLLVEHLALADRGGSSLPGWAGSVVTVVVVALVAWVGRTSRGEPERMLQGWALIALGVILLGPIGWAWYLITPLAVVSLSGERGRTAAVVGLSALAYMANLWTRNSDSLPDPAISRSAAYLLALLAMAVVVLAVHGRRRSGRGLVARR
jgi:hypothetical protein